MGSHAATNQLVRRLAVLWGFALVAFISLASLGYSAPPNRGLLAILAGMALIAEFLPVQLPRRGVRITFALPFVAAVAVAVGITNALVVDVVATSLVSFFLVRGRPSGVEGRWLASNAAISIISSAAAGLVITICFPSHTPIEGAMILFIGVYASVNLILVAYVEWSLTSRAWSANTDIVVRTAAIGFVLYSLVGLVVGVLLNEKIYWAILTTLIPVGALRTGLTYRARMDEVYYETIHSLTQMLQRAHPYTHGHLERVSRTAEEVAYRLGLSARRARLVREAAVLHDIGKIAVNESVLDKPGKLTEEELVHVRRHAEWGAEILAPVPGFADLVPWIRHHHERPDGTGYPDALPDHRIPIECKIIAVVDAYDAMTGDDDTRTRTYRDPMSEADALLELQRCSGTQFDCAVVEAFRLTISRRFE